MSELNSDQMLQMCLKKKRYHTYEFAEKLIGKINKHRSTPLRVYYCPVCFKYHLTSKENKYENDL